MKLLLANFFIDIEILNKNTQTKIALGSINYLN